MMEVMGKSSEGDWSNDDERTEEKGHFMRITI